MKKIIKLMAVLPLAFSFHYIFAQDPDAIREIEAHRKEQEREFKDPKKSPLETKDRKKFKGLHYYPIDLKYRVKAKFIKVEKPFLFEMETSTSRLVPYSKYATVIFTLDSISYSLEVYQSPDVMRMPGYADYLFIPFTDMTSGEETYQGGRYLDMRIPEGDEVTLDFNQCYNPYCSYGSGRYSCPIPPMANALQVAIPVGEKKWH